MKLSIKQLLKNRHKILEGIKNKVFKKEHECEYLDTEGNNCAMPGTHPCCADCGCSLSIKLRSLASECPKKKWPAYLTEDEEIKLMQQLEDEEQ